MANINDYIKWRGDLPINKEYPFNELDSLILARFSYMPFYKIKMNPKETLSSIGKKMNNVPDEDFLYNGDKELVTSLANSDRFKKMIVTDYVKNSDKKYERQFGAITIHISSKELYISYLGTDLTINGWKEDFNMMFLENVPCQLLGKDYLEKVAKKYLRTKIRVGGHSKGGNVAIYSAISTSKRIQNRIVKVYNYDGPGFRKEVLNKYKIDYFWPKIQTYIPQDSVIGRLLYHKEKMAVAYSLEKGILQHDIFSWEVLKDDLIYSSKSTDGSEVVDQTLTTWFEETTNEQRKIVVDTVFDLLYSTDSETFEDLSKNFAKKIPTIMKKYGEISKEDKDIIIQTIKMMLGTYIDIVKAKETKKIKNSIKNIGKRK